MTVFSWVLLVLSVIDIVYAHWQLFVLRSMRLIVDEMHPVMAWGVVAGPTMFAFAASIWSLNWPPDRYPSVWGLPLAVGFISFAAVILFQLAATEPIIKRKRLEWDESNKQRNRVKSNN